MTIRQFVEAGNVGTHAERERFETQMLEAALDAQQHGIPSLADADVSLDLWIVAFDFHRMFTA